MALPGRHPPTILLPNVPKNTLIGLDLLSLTVSSRFNGFTAIPPGWHFLFIGATAELSSRQGLWLYIPDASIATNSTNAGQKRERADSKPLGVRGAVLPVKEAAPLESDWLSVLIWDETVERLQLVSNPAELVEWRQKLLSSPDLQKTCFPYRQAVQPEQRVHEVGSDGDIALEPPMDFLSLTDQITTSLLERICGKTDTDVYSLETTSSSVVDAEAENIPGLEQNEKLQGLPLGLLDIDLRKTWRDNAIGRERTDAARDRSWRLSEVVDHSSPHTDFGDVTGAGIWGAGLLGEMQFCFLAVLTLSNWSCMAQWRRILELVLTSTTAIIRHPTLFEAFLNLLSTQLMHTNLVEGGLFDVSDDGGEFLKGLLRRFISTLDELEEADGEGTVQVKKAMRSLQEVVRDIWGWELSGDWVRKGLVQLEDGEEVELETQEMEDEDERGEYAPVIVEDIAA